MNGGMDQYGRGAEKVNESKLADACTALVSLQRYLFTISVMPQQHELDELDVCCEQLQRV